MKKSLILLTTYFLLGIYSIQSQTLYSTIPSGKNNSGGAIIKFLPATNNLIVAKSFETVGRHPRSSFIQATDGKLYGTTSRGGIQESQAEKGYGIIFSYDPFNAAYTILKEFDNESGSYPAGLIQATDGKLYGMTYRGGINGGKGDGYGVIFSFDPLSAAYTKLHLFDGMNGADPEGSLIQGSDGKLYGTANGGTKNGGVIFSFDPSSSIFTKLKDFEGTDGASPHDLMQANDGKLYGMTNSGGSSGSGVIFSFDLSSGTYIKLMDFEGGVNGGSPYGSLIQSSDGKLYGTASGGTKDRGIIFSFDPSSGTYTKLRNFGATDGNSPRGRMQASNGKLYGMSYGGGSQRLGIIFSFDPLSSTYTKLKDFDSTNGASPEGSLMRASDGRLYGMTRDGGILDRGVIFSLDPSTAIYTKLRDFGSNENGSYVTSAFTLASDGKLYGLTSGGGNNGYGAAFSYDPSTSDYKKLGDFNTDVFSSVGLMQAKNGKLYGTAHSGGKYNRGVIFSYDLSTSIYTKLKDFDENEYATYSPVGSLIEASNGKLYGVTAGGGVVNGVIFSYDPSTSVYTRLRNFLNSYPAGSLMQASDGKLYGMADGGTQDCHCGFIFSYDPSNSVYKKLKDFDGVNGGSPPLGAGLIQAIDGKLYGTLSSGGENVEGVIFSFDPLSGTYTKLFEFDYDGKNGTRPLGNLMQASDGKLYGRTLFGGSINNNYGNIFSYDPLTSIYTKLKDNPGRVSDFTTTFIEVNSPPTITLTTPANNATYLAGGNVYLNAAASDADGTISKVEFYNDSTLLYTATDTPYTFKWQKVKKGNYTVTAKATDNSGLVTTSVPVNISVVPNKPPTVSIITPSNDQTFTTPANIHFEAAAADVDGRVTIVEFYNGPTLLTLERKIPYTYDWTNVPAGVYTITARATDNWGAVTISAPVTVTVTSPNDIAGSRQASLNNKMDKDGTFSLQLAPNPAKNAVNIYTTGLQKNKQVTLSVISATGVIMKTMRLAGVAQSIPLNVSSLVSGVYTVKLVSGDKISYGKFIKL